MNNKTSLLPFADMSHLRFSFVEENGVVGVKNNKTGEKVFPSCGKDLPSIYAYISGSDGEESAQKMLGGVLNGETPITDLHSQLAHPKFVGRFTV